MAANSTLTPAHETGWRRGLSNMLNKENGGWWKTRSWLVQTIIWLLILNGILATLLWASPDNVRVRVNGEQLDETTAGIEALMEVKTTAGLVTFILIAGMAPAVGVIIIGQDALIGEKQSGTAAWVLSKPVSRNAFILSKLIAHAFGILITAIVIQAIIAYIQISATNKGLWPPGPFIVAIGLVFLNLLFYLTLTLMLGSIFNGRGAVIGISMLLLFGYQLFLGAAPWLGAIMPWGLVTQAGQGLPLAVRVALGSPATPVTPIVATALWCVLFVAVALWRFNREEF